MRGCRLSGSPKNSSFELTEHHLLSLAADNPIQKPVDAQLRLLDRPTHRSGALQNIQSIIAMVEAGHGVAALPAFVAPACERYDVTIQTLGEPVIPIDLFVVSKKGRQKTELAAKLIAALGKHFRSVARSATT